MAARCDVCGYHLERQDGDGRMACYGCTATLLEELGNVKTPEWDLMMGGHPRVNCWCMFPAPPNTPLTAHEEVCRRAHAALGVV